MPESESYPRGKGRLPVRLSGDGLVHQCEQVRGLVLDLHVDVEDNVTIFALENIDLRL